MEYVHQMKQGQQVEWGGSRCLSRGSIVTWKFFSNKCIFSLLSSSHMPSDFSSKITEWLEGEDQQIGVVGLQGECDIGIVGRLCSNRIVTCIRNFLKEIHTTTAGFWQLQICIDYKTLQSYNADDAKLFRIRSFNSNLLQLQCFQGEILPKSISTQAGVSGAIVREYQVSLHRSALPDPPIQGRKVEHELEYIILSVILWCKVRLVHM